MVDIAAREVPNTDLADGFWCPKTSKKRLCVTPSAINSERTHARMGIPEIEKNWKTQASVELYSL